MRRSRDLFSSAKEFCVRFGARRERSFIRRNNKQLREIAKKKVCGGTPRARERAGGRTSAAGAGRRAGPRSSLTSEGLQRSRLRRRARRSERRPLGGSESSSGRESRAPDNARRGPVTPAGNAERLGLRHPAAAAAVERLTHPRPARPGGGRDLPALPLGSPRPLVPPPPPSPDPSFHPMSRAPLPSAAN